jgi:hypothetical protein
MGMNAIDEAINEHLRTCMLLIGSGSLDRAAWRLADAGLMLRQRLESMGRTDLTGLDEVTGLGALLPQEEPVKEEEEEEDRPATLEDMDELSQQMIDRERE